VALKEATMVMLICAVARCRVDSASTTCAVKVEGPAAAGVPEIDPLLLKLKPSGRLPEATLHV
jgi:hypothetical protein